MNFNIANFDIANFDIVIEKAKNNYAGYVLKLPGCVATGQTIKETTERLQEAIKIHCQGLIEDGILIIK